MPQNRYYFPHRLVLGEEISLKDEEFRYMRTVMRTKLGDTATLINGKGVLAKVEVVGLSDKEARLHIVDLKEQADVPFTLTLALAFLKPAHLEYAVEKGCEVGVSRFWLFPAARSEKKAVSDQYLKRLDAIILASTKQCGSLFMPSLEVKKNLADCIAGLTLFGDLESTTLLAAQPLDKSVTLVIGPESGFSEDERRLLLDKGAKGVLLHPNTLRAETAAVVGSCLLFEKLNTKYTLVN